jgi:hypothetical protein
MLEFSKTILRSVSFDKSLFKKELRKSAMWLSKRDMLKLKIWALATFSQYNYIIIDVFEKIS